MDWAGEKNVCSAYACPALRLLGTPRLPTRPGDSSTHDSLTKKLRGLGGTCQAQSSNAKPCKIHVMPCEKSCKARYYSRPYIHVHPAVIAFFQRKTVQTAPDHLHVCPRMRGRAKKTGPVKKEWQVGRNNDSRSLLARGRAADSGGPALLLPPGPAASQQGLRLQPVPHPRARALCRAERRLTKLGKGFFRDKCYETSGQEAQRAERRRGLQAQGLAAGE